MIRAHLLVFLLVFSTCAADEAPTQRDQPAPEKSGEEKTATDKSSSDTKADDKTTVEDEPDAIRPKDRLIAEYRKFTRAFARRGRPKSSDVTVPMVALYHELRIAKSISNKDRSSMRKRLKILLEETQRRLYSQLKEAGVKDPIQAVAAAKLAAESRASVDASEESSPGESSDDGQRESENPAVGAATIQVAMQLISLIEDTIAPDSWETRGGQGSIRFLSGLNVLVIRATGEVHHQIGGTLEQVRRIQ